MAGIYIHIPFCRKACTYCDFHFSTSMSKKTQMVEALCKEIKLRKDYLGVSDIDSIYLGGGTPSVLTSEELMALFEEIGRHFNIVEGAEITLEANPDDLHQEKLKDLWNSPVNRLSIGIQSFDDDDLQFMNRAHTAKESLDCVEEARKVGFENLTVDVIYGIPGRDLEHWKKQLQLLSELDTPHVSAYALTVEKETVLENWIRKGKVAAPNESEQEQSFALLTEMLVSKGYEHYEISNFAKSGHRAIHNSAYWKSEPYLGVGPSAHSFDTLSRQWNVSNNHLYISAIESDELHFEREDLSVADRYNERIMTSLRTVEGIDLKRIDEDFGADFGRLLDTEAEVLEKEGKLKKEGGRLYIPSSQRFFADGIASRLFYV